MATPGQADSSHVEKANAYVQPSNFDMFAGASPVWAMDGWAE
jgi:hypothetical protein